VGDDVLPARRHIVARRAGRLLGTEHIPFRRRKVADLAEILVEPNALLIGLREYRSLAAGSRIGAKDRLIRRRVVVSLRLEIELAPALVERFLMPPVETLLRLLEARKRAAVRAAGADESVRRARIGRA